MIDRQWIDPEDEVEWWVDDFQRGNDSEDCFRHLFEHHYRLLLGFFRRRDLAALPPKMRLCAMLRWYHGYAYREIARLAGSSPEAARVQVFKARQRMLKASLDSLNEPEVD